MSVKYSLSLMSSKPGDQKAKKLYYAKAQAYGEVTMDEMAEDIAYSTTLTDGDVLNVIRALIRQMKIKLAQGKVVKMENLGNFQLQLRSKGAESKKEFKASNIIGSHIQFRPGKMVKVVTQGGLTYERVYGKKEAHDIADPIIPDPHKPDSGKTDDGKDDDNIPDPLS